VIQGRLDSLEELAQGVKEEMHTLKATRDEVEVSVFPCPRTFVNPRPNARSNFLRQRHRIEKLEEEMAALQARLQQADAGMFKQPESSYLHGECKEEDAGGVVLQTLYSQKEHECEELKLANVRMEQEAAQLKLAKEALEESLNKAKSDTEIKEQEAAQLKQRNCADIEKLEEEMAVLQAKLQQAEAIMSEQPRSSHPHGICKEVDKNVHSKTLRILQSRLDELERKASIETGNVRPPTPALVPFLPILHWLLSMHLPLPKVFIKSSAAH
jgi:hypothetical protein